MAKKALKIDVSPAPSVAGDVGGDAEVAAIERADARAFDCADPREVPFVPAIKYERVDDRADPREERLFALFVARVSTIDRYRVPIKDSGLAAAYETALFEARVALEQYEKGIKK